MFSFVGSKEAVIAEPTQVTEIKVAVQPRTQISRSEAPKLPRTSIQLAQAPDPKPTPEPEPDLEIISSGTQLVVFSIPRLPPNSAVFWALPEAINDDNYHTVRESEVFVSFPILPQEVTYDFKAFVVVNGDPRPVGKELKYSFVHPGTTPPGPSPTPPGPGPVPPPNPVVKPAKIIVILESESKTLEQEQMLVAIRKSGTPFRIVDPDEPVSGTNEKVVDKFFYAAAVKAANLNYPAILFLDANGAVIKAASFEKGKF